MFLLTQLPSAPPVSNMMCIQTEAREEEDPSGNEASCTYCTKKLSANSKGGTSHLRRHVNKCALRRLQALLMDI
uniref:BED-type domain-containing protein n=1 Tax=Oryza glumipatula TaxID=40148 RepID=A0A0E0BUI0_9ORYZ